MKNLIFILALSLPSLSYAQNCRPGDLDLADAYVKAITKQVDEGMLSTSSIQMAKAIQLDVQVCSEKISLVDYCTQKDALLKALSTFAMKHIESSGATTSLLGWVLNQVVALRTACKPAL